MKIRTLITILMILFSLLFLFLPSGLLNLGTFVRIFLQNDFVLKPAEPYLSQSPYVLYPYVSAKPSSPQYKFTEVSDYLSLIQNKDYGGQAFKRVSEMEKWKNDLDWDFQFSKYSNLIFNWSIQVKNRDKYIEFESYIWKNFLKIDSIISSTNFSDLDKDALRKRNFEIYQNTIKNFKSIPTEKDYQSVQYHIDDILREKQYGYFDVYVQKKDGEESLFLRNVKVDKDNPVLSLPLSMEVEIKKDETRPSSENLQYSVNFPQNLTSAVLFLNRADLSQELTISFSEATKSAIEARNSWILPKFVDKAKFVFDLPPDVEKRQMILTVKRNNNFSNGEQIENQVTPLEFQIFAFDHPDLRLVKTKDLENSEPQVFITKIDRDNYRVNMVNMTLEEENEIVGQLPIGWVLKGQVAHFWIRDLLKMGMALSFTTLFLTFFWKKIFLVVQLVLRTLQVFGEKMSSVMIKTFALLVIRPASYFRLPLLLLSVSGIFFDAIFVSRQSDLVYTFLIFLAALAILGYKVEGRTHFLLSLVTILMCPVFSVFGSELVVEKFAVYTFLFLVLGALWQFWEVKSTHNLANLKRFSVLLLLDLAKITNLFVKLLQVFIRKRWLSYFTITSETDLQKNLLNLKIKVTQIYGEKPKNFSEWVSLSGKVFSTLALAVFIIFLLFGFIFLIVGVRKQIDKNSLYPEVKLVEPQVVYPNNVVLVHGRSFSEAQTKQYEVFDQNGRKVDLQAESDDGLAIFKLGLDWPVGTFDLKIKKVVSWEGKDEIFESRSFRVIVIPRNLGQSLTSDDLNFLNQIPKLSPEAKRWNGY